MSAPKQREPEAAHPGAQQVGDRLHPADPVEAEMGLLMTHGQTLGRYGEELVAGHLERRGCRIAARNFSSPMGELDIVAERTGSFIFVEVKTRIGGEGLCQALGYAQIKRLQKMAQAFLQQAHAEDRDYLFWVYYVLMRHARDRNPRLIRIQEPF